MVDFDVFDLLANSVDQADDDTSDNADAPLPSPLPALVVGKKLQEIPEHQIVVETVLLEDVRMLGEMRFNSTNHHEWTPFRDDGEESVLVDPGWWASLGDAMKVGIKAMVDIQVASHDICVPHEPQIGQGRGSCSVYQAYLDLFSFARWAMLKPDARIVPLESKDRVALEELARRHVLGGTPLQDNDLESVSASLLHALEDAIHEVGGSAFVKTAEKSAKNDVVLKAHTSAKSIIKELTSSQDVLQQSLGRGGTGKRRTARYLVVQPWIEGITKSNEFRVIIGCGKVVGITQQSWGCFVGHGAESVLAFVPPILRLWYEALLPKCPYADCVLDVYVMNDLAYLIEINPIGFWGSSGSGLFHWNYDREILLDPNRLVVRAVVEHPDDATLDASKALG